MLTTGRPYRDLGGDYYPHPLWSRPAPWSADGFGAVPGP
jgi:hypothetical protein